MKIYEELEQGSDAWLEARRGILTASEMNLAVTPTGKIANNDKTRKHVYELAAQRVTGHTEPTYISDDMLRGMMEEDTARDLYSKHYAEATEVGFITEDKWGFTLGYSPDGLVGDDGLIEIKCPRQKKHFETIVANEPPAEHMAQLQTGLLVSGREWIDFISYCAGMPLFVKRVYPDQELQDIIIEGAGAFYHKLDEVTMAYKTHSAALHQTERPDEGENVISIL